MQFYRVLFVNAKCSFASPVPDLFPLEHHGHDRHRPIIKNERGGEMDLQELFELAKKNKCDVSNGN